MILISFWAKFGHNLASILEFPYIFIRQGLKREPVTTASRMIKMIKIIRPIGTVLCIMAMIAAAFGAADDSARAGLDGGSRHPQGSGMLGHQKGPVVGGYSMEQTLSDQAQQATIAFDALAFLTGDTCSDTFLPPGKVADYAGFQYLRDNDPTEMGHNTDFVTRIADNVLSILNSEQLSQFISLSKAEAELSDQFAYMRFPLIKAFRAQLEGNITVGSSGLDRSAVINYSAKLYDVDASISMQRAKAYAEVIRSLNESQRTYLDGLARQGMLYWPQANASLVLKSSGQGNSVAMRTYASEMFSWYAGSIESDVYFCPERQATYFGSFYMKDRPAMGNPGYSISTTLTGDAGNDFLNLLDAGPREKVTGLVDRQRADLEEIVFLRRRIAADLRRALQGEAINETAVRALSARYGELDGEISYYYAMCFAEVAESLTEEQKQKMTALRGLDGFVCQGAYLYSQPISMPENVPSDFLFGTGEYNSSQFSSWLKSQKKEMAGQRSGQDNRLPSGNSSRQEPPPDRDDRQSGSASYSASSFAPCLNHTGNNPDCKDCCDCTDGNASARKTCRDACASHDFSQNTDIVAVLPISVSGPGGDYSNCTTKGGEQACKECCDSSAEISCGDRRFCRDACNKVSQEKEQIDKISGVED